MTEPTHRVLIGDCRESMRSLPAGSVHCCVTSPPYFQLRNYGIAGQIGLEQTAEEFIAVMVDVFRGVRRVLRDDGVLFMNLGDSYGDGKQLQGIPWRVALALQSDNWVLRQDIIWSKPAPMPESVRDRCTKSHEYIFLLTKRPRYFYDAEAVKERSGHPKLEGKRQKVSYHDVTAMRNDCDRVVIRTGNRNRRSVWTINTEPCKLTHFATFPTKLVEPCILAGTSAAGCCAECGKPWERVVEKPEMMRVGDSEIDRYGSGNAGVHRKVGQKYQDWRSQNPDKTTGWRPTCPCGVPAVPCTVLDPFGGSGTTAGVALYHRRNAILCELNPEYAAMVPGRIDDVIRRMRKREAKRAERKQAKPLAGQKTLWSE